MLYLMKIFLGLCISAVLCGCPLFATLFGYTAYEGYALMLSADTVEPIINVEQEVGFATVTGTYDIMKADKKVDSALPTDTICICYGNYIGYTGQDGMFVPETAISVAGADAGVSREYANIWGTLHIGALLGGTNTTDYKGYFVEETLGLNPADFIKQDESQTAEGVTYEYYSCKDAVLGLDRMLKIFYCNDRTGAIYMYGVRDYTISTAPLLDDFSFISFQADRSFALSDAIGGYVAGGQDDGTLFSVDNYEGEWDNGYVSIDGVSYNLNATNLRALEAAGVVPFDDNYIEEGYDTPTNGGRKEVQFLFGGTRILTLKLEFASGSDKVLRDAKVYGFSASLLNNFVTEEERVRGSYGVHPTGEAVSEEEFISTYFGGAPYTVTKDGAMHYYTADGTEISRADYETILHGGTVDLTEASEDDDADAEEASDDADADEDEADANGEDTEDGAGTEDDTEEGEDTADTEDDTNTTEGEGGFASLGSGDGNAPAIVAVDNPDWFVIGGLHSNVTLSALEIYLKNYATKYTPMGSGNSVTYTVERGSAKMIFTLEMNTTISSMEVTYEDV